MDNMNRFPAIADLRMYIEGSDEDHSNKAWDALGSMIRSDRAASFILYDLALARTIQQTWIGILGVRVAFARPMDQFGRDAMKRAFRVAYLDNYKQRARLRQDMAYPTVLEVEPNPQPKLDDYVVIDYMLDSSYNLVEISRRTIKALPRGEGMTPEQREKLDALLNNIGRDRKRFVEPQADTPKLIAIVPSRLVRSDTGDVDIERVRKYAQHIKSQSTVPDDSTQGDAADGNAATGTGPDEHADRRKTYCTCRSVANGNECNCGGKG